MKELCNEKQTQRPRFPKRAVVTAGMPYGNKELHFGHIGGVFIPADVYARFLRDRLGEENVIFVSGTDCYGSTIEQSYFNAKEDAQTSIEAFVSGFHEKQKQVLERYEISLNQFAASALGLAGEVHKEISREVFESLYKSDFLKLEETHQFYDDEQETFLNGRQVRGYCPIQGCKSEFAYADECSLGHQYRPSELIKPVSMLSGKTPSLRCVKNWYFDLPAFRTSLEKRNELLQGKENCRKIQLTKTNEFLKDPIIFVKKDALEDMERWKTLLPPFTLVDDPQKPSYSLAFQSLEERDMACTVLTSHQIRYRTGKAVVPFRISGNVKWGIPVPEKEGAQGLTFWVWPESLWAPISFTEAYLRQTHSTETWEDWWKSNDTQIYQFIGEDNIYFYCLAEMGMFMALQNNGTCAEIEPGDGVLQLPHIIANHHLLFQNSKASSSSEKKPPKAGELLSYYNAEQLRMHFINADLENKSISFSPKALEPAQKQEYDPVLYEGNLLTNIFNRIVRSCFYTSQKLFLGKIPSGEISPEVLAQSRDTILTYERHMYQFEFNKTFELLNLYLRDANKNWAAKSREAKDDEAQMKQLLIDTFHIVRTAIALLHPFAPTGCEKVLDYLRVSPTLCSWDSIFEPITHFIDQDHTLKFLEPRVDFFEKIVPEEASVPSK